MPEFNVEGIPDLVIWLAIGAGVFLALGFVFRMVKFLFFIAGILGLAAVSFYAYTALFAPETEEVLGVPVVDMSEVVTEVENVIVSIDEAIEENTGPEAEEDE